MGQAASTAMSPQGRRSVVTSRKLAPLWFIVVLVILWESWALIVDIRILSRPSEVVSAGATYLVDPRFFRHLATTALHLLLGMSAALVIGWPLGLLIGRSQTLFLLSDFLILGLNAMPRSALMPLIAVWVGIGVSGKATVVFMAAVVPILINVIVGVRTMDADLIRVSRSFCASRAHMFALVVLPAALPHLLASVRLGISSGLVGVIFAEMYVASWGLGNLIVRAGSALRADSLFFLAFVAGAMGYGLVGLVYLAEGRWTPWFRQTSV